MIARELLLRKAAVLKTSWFNLIEVYIAMAISVSYEFAEWGMSLGTGEGGNSGLGTQGEIWDTQSDMLFAAIGAIVALLILGKIHSQQIKMITSGT